MKASRSEKYITLIVSLPNMTHFLGAKVTPLSRLKLEQRLSALSIPDRQTLDTIENLLDWKKIQSADDFSEIVKRSNQTFASIKSETLRKLIQHRLEIRSYLVALRMRERGYPPPSETSWGFGRWQKHMVEHWNEPAFGLQHNFSWAAEAEALLKQKQSFELEQLLLDIAFKQLQRAGTQHLFDFEAVVIYVLKWNIVSRVTQYNSHSALIRFQDLLNQNLQDSQGHLTCQSQPANM